MTPDIVLRPLNERDANECHLVLGTWLDSYARSNLALDSCPKCQWGIKDVTRRMFPFAVFHRLYGPVVNDAFARSTIVIASSPEVTDSVLGWMATEGNTIHYVFVKPRWRRIGVARKLLAGAESVPVSYSHEPPRWAKLPASWRYAPEARFGDHT